ncbi:hypothetical protein CEXT_186221, partial [Caerostris extrusa]
SNFEVF